MSELSPRLRAVVDALPLREGMRVLEIGGAPGAAARAVADIVGPSGYVLVVDRSAKGIALTEKNCSAEIERGTIGVHHAGVEHLELPRSELLFDIAFACRVGVLDGRHPRQYADALTRLRNATVPGARLYVDTGAPLNAIELHE